jgi:hypothetical protein
MPAKPKWKDIMEDLLDGIEGELRPSTRLRAKKSLRPFRTRLSRSLTARERKRFERELEAFLQGEPIVRAASKRFLKKRVNEVVGRAVLTLKRAETVLKKWGK